MIARGNVVKLSVDISDTPGLREKHMYVCSEANLGHKEFANCTTSAGKLLLRHKLKGPQSTLVVLSRNENPKSPFDKMTDIILDCVYIVDNVRVDQCLLTVPPMLPKSIEDEFFRRFTPSTKRILDTDSVCKFNKFVYSPY